MPVRRPAWAALLLALLLLPGASAFATREEPLSLTYARSGDVPPVFATGALAVEGALEGGFLAANVRDVTLTDVPRLTVTERGLAGLPMNATHRDVDVVVHDGALLWRFHDGASLDLALDAPYGMGLALPELPAQGLASGAAMLLAAPSLRGDLSWRGVGDLLLLDAEVTLLDARGQVVPGWERREVNAGASAGSDASGLDVLFEVSGAFRGTSDAGIQGGAVGGSDAISLSVSPADEPRFAQTLDVLAQAGALFGPEASDTFGPDNPMRQLEPFSPLLNGALLVVAAPVDGSEEDAPEPLESRLGDADFDAAPMSLLRGDPMTVAWSGDEMRIQGTPTVAVSKAGFAVDEPIRVWLIPLVSLVLWALAAAAVVVYFVKRPPKADAPLALRLVSFAVYLVALAVAFWTWDQSFAATFGTSVLTLFREGTALEDPARLGFLAAVQLAPWGLAALLFALPVRIALGVALRYVGKGKAYKGVAKAGGLVALAVFGPLYALWILNVVLTEAFARLPSMFG